MMNFSRRNFLRVSGIGLVASRVPGAIAGDVYTTTHGTPGKLPLKLGIASYTLREFSLEETIAMTNRLEIKNLALKSRKLWNG